MMGLENWGNGGMGGMVQWVLGLLLIILNRMGVPYMHPGNIIPTMKGTDKEN
jgi:hypothetical protein